MKSDRDPKQIQSGVDPFSDEKIIESWRKNAEPWTAAVRNEEIQSRKLATNGAILESILSRNPKTVLDIGCGEGWLAHRLASRGIAVLGTDVVPELIEKASETGSTAHFKVISYEEIARGGLSGRFDAVVCNFALLGNESVANLFKAIPSLLNPKGSFIVQTIHPLIGCGDLPYVDGWRKGSWDGFNSEFTDPAPWYFRTLESWKGLFTSNGFILTEIREPVNPLTEKFASVIFHGEKTDRN
jgi:2-polyprenyl-3-methyl-5-hydroxy-6-metoxy-1,4-benzoquinol methylase